ncbi:hypothetical protein BU16DRAFT_622924 [Lophium mytilinum]|uniref:Uncharacterized protein n=1 Tax=Lophium mytilinum TaxID=390894 RepID=A0A6A6QAW2_9PEZI|nr:hypothetical protein BU16DRAFT_622924 [Lophium mytilinum]
MEDPITQYDTLRSQLAELSDSLEQKSTALHKIRGHTERISARLKKLQKREADLIRRDTELEDELEKIEERKLDIGRQIFVLKKRERALRKSQVPHRQNFATPPLQRDQAELTLPVVNQAAPSRAACNVNPTSSRRMADPGSEDDFDGSDDNPGLEAPNPSEIIGHDDTTGIRTEHGTTYLIDYSHVTRLDDGSWVELQCGICGVNYHGKNDYYKSLNGFKRHLSRFHQIPTLADDQVVAHCKIVRRLSTDEIDALRLGLPGALTMRKIAGSTVDQTAPNYNATNGNSGINTMQTSTDDIVLRLFPTIIKLPNTKYVELRCNVNGCGINSVNYRANQATEFKGLNGFGKHLKQSHPEEWDAITDCVTYSTRGLPSPAERVLSLCSQRELTDREVEGIRQRGREAYKIDCKTATRKRDRDRHRVTRSTSDDDESADTADETESDFEGDNRVGIKRARQSKSGQDSCRKPSRRTTTSIQDKITVDMSPPRPNTTQHQLEDYCPCSLSGHPCRMAGCEKPKICLNFPHSDACKTSEDCHLRPTCTNVAALQHCHRHDCPDGHDDAALRRVRFQHNHTSH